MTTFKEVFFQNLSVNICSYHPLDQAQLHEILCNNDVANELLQNIMKHFSNHSSFENYNKFIDEINTISAQEFIKHKENHQNKLRETAREYATTIVKESTCESLQDLFKTLNIAKLNDEAARDILISTTQSTLTDLSNIENPRRVKLIDDIILDNEKYKRTKELVKHMSKPIEFYNNASLIGASIGVAIGMIIGLKNTSRQVNLPAKLIASIFPPVFFGALIGGMIFVIGRLDTKEKREKLPKRQEAMKNAAQVRDTNLRSHAIHDFTAQLDSSQTPMETNVNLPQ